MSGALIALATGLWGCGASAPSNELITARETLAAARASEAAQYKPDEVHRAARTLGRAEAIYREEAGTALERDYAYIADRQARLAMAEGRRAALAAREESAEQEYRRRLETTTRARAEALGQTQESLEDTQQALAERQGQLAEQSETLQAREQELSAREQQLEQERLARAQAEQEAQQALEELADVRREQENLVITLNGSVLFEFGQTALLPSALRRLDAVAAVLRRHGDRRIVVEGHTDSVGSEAGNRALSQERAERVVEYMTRRGVPAENIRAVGRGESEPVATNRTQEGRTNNRRVEIIVEHGGTPQQ
jgi:outer membrane protein OmpA-like peptidoglycan-associated protein